MTGLYKCLWCGKLFQARVPTSITGEFLVQYHDPCPLPFENVSKEGTKATVAGIGQLIGVIEKT